MPGSSILFVQFSLLCSCLAPYIEHHTSMLHMWCLVLTMTFDHGSGTDDFWLFDESSFLCTLIFTFWDVVFPTFYTFWDVVFPTFFTFWDVVFPTLYTLWDAFPTTIFNFFSCRFCSYFVYFLLFSFCSYFVYFLLFRKCSYSLFSWTLEIKKKNL